MDEREKLEEARRVFDVEINALQQTRDVLGREFLDILSLITGCKGRVIITGMGKPGHIARKLAATFASLGTPSFALHPAEALHGDLGMITEQDVVIAISYSGESEEITRILPNIKMIGASLVGITGNSVSTLAKMSDYVQVLPAFDEACHLKLAPTSSTTVTLAYGDALAVTASEIYGFKEENFGMFHPAGALGKKLIIKVKDIMAKGDDNAIISKEETLKTAIVELSKKVLGIVTVVDSQGMIAGVITDGDLRRFLEKGVDVYTLGVEEVMSKSPSVIYEGKFAIDALKMLKERNISSAPVVDQTGKAVGTVGLQKILAAGIVL